MNQVLSLLPSDGWPRIAADVVWQSTLLGIVGLLCARFMARRPATQALVSLVAMLAAVVTPITSVTSRSFGWGMLKPTVIADALSDEDVDAPLPARANPTTNVAAVDQPTRSSGIQSLRQPVKVPTGIENPDVAHYAKVHLPSVGFESPSAWEIVLFFWCATSGVMLFRLCRCVWQTMCLLRSALPCGVPHIVAALHNAARRVDVVPPRLVVSLAVDTPTAFAFGRGIIVLPQSETSLPVFLSDPPPLTGSGSIHSHWIAVLCHELAHIRRRDGLSRLAAEIVMVLLPWQPLLWFLRANYLRYSEEACDDWAVVAGADPIEFASLLINLVPTKPPIRLGATIMNTDVKPRIHRLLSLSETPLPSTGWLARAAITIVACVTIVGGALAQRNTDEALVDEQSSQTPADVKKDGKVPSIFVPTPSPRYILEPPDIVAIEAVKLLPKGALKIEKLDHLEIKATGTLFDHPIRSTYVVDEDGEVNLGPEYGRVHVDGLTVKAAIHRIEEHLAKTLKQPKVSLSVAHRAIEKHVSGKHLIGPDGFVALGPMGQVQIAGMTIDEARQAIEKHLGERFDKPSVAVELHTSNSKVYYVIVEGIEAGDNIDRYPITGNETVLDALTQAHGLARFSGKTGWIMRPSASGKGFQVLKVKLDDIVQGRVETNHRLRPGDRIFIREAEVPSQ